MTAWGYEFYLRVLKVSLTHSLHSLVRDTFSTRRSPRGHVISSISATWRNCIKRSDHYMTCNNIMSITTFKYF